MKKINISTGLKGILLALGSAFFLSLVFVFSRLIRENMSTELFIFWWFAFASVWALVILASRFKDFGSYIDVIRVHWKFILYIVASEAAAVFVFFYMIKQVNPAVVAFFVSFSPVLVVVIAFFYINEKMKKFELIGGFLSIAGVVVITYVSPGIGPGLFALAFLLIAIYSFNNVLLRKKVKDVPPIVIVVSRIFCLSVLYGAIVISNGSFRLPNATEALLLAAGALSGPILNMYCLFSALKYIKAANVALIKNTQPFFVIILSLLVLKITISHEQFIGGIIVIFGVSILVSEKQLNRLLEKIAQTRKKSLLQIILILLLVLPLSPGTEELPNIEENILPVSISETQLPVAKVTFQPETIKDQIEQVLHYLNTYGTKDPHLQNLGVETNVISETLEFCRDILTEDLKNDRPSRLQDPEFLNQHFQVLGLDVHRTPDCSPVIGPVRLTKYAVFTIEGRQKPDQEFRCALYGLPEDEKGMSIAEAEKNRDRLHRFKYTKQMVLAGAFRTGGAKPLIWVKRWDLEKALMQGTICVKDEAGRKRYFNVTRGNEIPYIEGELNPAIQKRYWYFSEVQEPKGYGMDVESMVTIFPGVALAGDLHNLGFGRLIALQGKSIRLCILADTGGVFDQSLDHLDYFAGVFDSQEQFMEQIKCLPEFAHAYILVKR